MIPSAVTSRIVSALLWTTLACGLAMAGASACSTVKSTESTTAGSGARLADGLADGLPAKIDESMAKSSDLYFHQTVGKVEEHSLRQNQTAAHLYLDSSHEPYLFVAFPAANSGVGLWFQTPNVGDTFLSAISQPKAIERDGGLHGIEVALHSSSPRLTLEDSVLGSMRAIREREIGHETPKELRTLEISMQSGLLELKRRGLNGSAEYIIEVEPLKGTRIVKDGAQFRFEAKRDVEFRLRGFSSEPPLTAMTPDQIFKPEALSRLEPHQLLGFSFLLYKEKLAAGSPRYLSKFGRDSLITLHVLLSTMKPEAIENLLRAALSSADPMTGAISHEEHEGDFVSFEKLKQNRLTPGPNDVIEDYKMIDSDFLFTIVLTEYMKFNPDRVANFLKLKDMRGIALKKLIDLNFKYVMSAAQPFADHPIAKHLVRLHLGERAGNWRDSDSGLGGGVYPFDVNTALVPAALHGLRDTYTKIPGYKNAAIAARMNRALHVWNEKAPAFFTVRVGPEKTVAATTYWKELGYPESLLPPAPEEDIVFGAVSLDTDGLPIPVMNSDDSFAMTFGFPDPPRLDAAAQRVLLPFPYGLATPAGILVANPAFASLALRQELDGSKYHGTVSWVMQEDLLLYGFERQIARTDLASDLKNRMRMAREAVQRSMVDQLKMGAQEVFGIAYRDGQFRATPFGGETKSNSNQLWSYLRIADPITKDLRDPEIIPTRRLPAPDTPPLEIRRPASLDVPRTSK